MCSSRKYPSPPQGRLKEIPKGRGVLESQFLERKYDTKMLFQEGWGFNLKNLLWEGYGYFLELHNLNITCSALFSNVFTTCTCTSILGSLVYEKLCAALTQNSLVRGIKQASPFAQTSCLEGFHSLLNQFAPKMIGYSYVGLYCRCVS